jgi:hypothetical protein
MEKGTWMLEKHLTFWHLLNQSETLIQVASKMHLLMSIIIEKTEKQWINCIKCRLALSKVVLFIEIKVFPFKLYYDNQTEENSYRNSGKETLPFYLSLLNRLITQSICYLKHIILRGET